MRRWLAVGVGIGLLAAGSMFGQGRPGQRSYGQGFGNVLFPGGVRQPSVGPPSFAHGLGTIVSGGGYTGRPSGPRRAGRPVYVPLPVYVGGYGYGGFGNYFGGYPDNTPNVTVIMQPPMGQAPTVFNQNYMPETTRVYDGDAEEAAPRAGPRSGLRTYEAPMPYQVPEPEEERAAPVKPTRRGARSVKAPTALLQSDVMEQKATIYLIAFKDHTIQPAYAYWTEADTLHYVTVQGSHNRATLDLIDKEMSERLNHERSVEFSLTQAR